MARNSVEEDPSVNALIESGTPVVCIFGKTWELHVRKALGITEEENLKLIDHKINVYRGRLAAGDADQLWAPKRPTAAR